MRAPLAIATTLLLLQPTAPAQRALPEPRQVSVERSWQGSYSEPMSRELFTACDRDADDRLDVFEAADAFPALPTPRDTQGFARFDTDRDGYVTWPEFDATFRRGLRNGGTFRVVTCRPFAPPPPPAAPATPLQRFLQLHDADGDGALSPAEIDGLLQQAGLPPGLAEPLRQSDVDGSGKVEEAELAKWFQALPIAALLGGATAPSPLPQPWFTADEDRSGTIDQRELEQVLRRVDPGLARWSDAFFRGLDKDHNGTIDPGELPKPAAEPGTDPAPTRTPPTAPQR